MTEAQLKFLEHINKQSIGITATRIAKELNYNVPSERFGNTGVGPAYKVLDALYRREWVRLLESGQYQITELGRQKLREYGQGD